MTLKLRRADLGIYQGDDWLTTVTVMDSNFQPVDLTGYTAEAQIRNAIADQQPKVSAQFNCAVILPNSIVLSLSHAQTVVMSGQYYWDLQVVSPAGLITTILAGEVTVTPEITRTAVPLATWQYEIPPALWQYHNPPVIGGTVAAPSLSRGNVIALLAETKQGG